uniref:PH domain-containing protein n=1 Tax=Oryza meridionalis TaxID=40149 RepID=A0A0E0DS78_9ORYZ
MAVSLWRAVMGAAGGGGSSSSSAAGGDAGGGVEFWHGGERTGWLNKQGEYIKTWRRRWFVLKQGRLFWFKDAAVTRGSVPRGVIPVATCLTVKGAEDVINRQFAFELSTPTDTMYFIADSEKEKEEWINSIGRSIVQHSRSVTDAEVVDYDSRPNSKPPPQPKTSEDSEPSALQQSLLTGLKEDFGAKPRAQALPSLGWPAPPSRKARHFKIQREAEAEETKRGPRPVPAAARPRPLLSLRRTLSSTVIYSLVGSSPSPPANLPYSRFLPTAKTPTKPSCSLPCPTTPVLTRLVATRSIDRLVKRPGLAAPLSRPKSPPPLLQSPPLPYYMEAAALGGPRVQVRAAVAAYGRGAGKGKGKRRVVGAFHAPPGRRRTALVAALPEPLQPLSPAQDGAVAAVAPPAPEADGGEEVHGDVASAEISSPSGVLGKTVRVRFVLKRECTFGQSFHLVGDDPALGLWDPSKAVPLDWSEGHDWTVEKDLPANRLIEYKFVLQDLSGKLHWQNGRNRSVQIGETANILVVYEDWGNANSQTIEEEGKVSIGMEEGKLSVGMEEAVVPDDSESRDDIIVADELQVDDNLAVMQNESSVREDDNKSTVGTVTSVQAELMKLHEANQPELIADEPQIQEALPETADTEPENGGVTTCADDRYAESTDDDGGTDDDGVPVENRWTGAFEHELLWGWKALQQLLMSLGFKMDTS